MNIVVITGRFYPDPSPTGFVVKQCCEMLKQGNSIRVIYVQSGKKRVDGMFLEDIRLFSLTDKFWELEQELYQGPKQDSIIYQAEFHLKKFLVFTYKGLRSLCLFPSGMKWFAEKSYCMLKEMHNESKIDVLITSCSPFAANIAGILFKKGNPNVRWITLTLDPFYKTLVKDRNILFRFILTRKARKKESEVYRTADANLVTDAVFEHKESYEVYPRKSTGILHFILPKQVASDNEYFDKSTINLLYAGGFYKKIRNPEFALKTLLLVRKTNIHLHLYTNNSCRKMVDFYIGRSNGRFFRHVPVTQEEIRKIMYDSDILLDIGNATAGVKPSKTLEYISTGRPIIQFYYNGFFDNILARYPLALQIDQTKTKINDAVQLVERFCSENAGKRMTYEEITTIYSEHSWESVRDLLKKTVGSN